MIIKNSNLNLEQIATSGQAFRWYKNGEGYVVVAGHKAVKMKEVNGGIDIDDEDDFWLDYLDITRDYQAIIDQYKLKDEFLEKATAYGDGIRILKQDPFEITVTFIISANNNITRITSAIKMISERYGDYLKTIDGVKYYDFPRPDQLKDVSIEEFRACGLGYRDKYLFQLIQDIMQNKIDLYAIKNLGDDELKKALLRLKGIGEKVCNCIILFGYQRYEGFPIDTWIKKVLVDVYGIKTNQEDFAKDYFKPYGGIAQQYLFYYGRSVKLT